MPMPPASPQSRTEGNELRGVYRMNVLKWIAIGGAAWLLLAVLFVIGWARMFGGKR